MGNLRLLIKNLLNALLCSSNVKESCLSAAEIMETLH